MKEEVIVEMDSLIPMEIQDPRVAEVKDKSRVKRQYVDFLPKSIVWGCLADSVGGACDS